MSDRGSPCLCSVGLLPLGLPATDEFWSAPPQPWTAARAWSGQTFPIDHALSEGSGLPSSTSRTRARMNRRPGLELQLERQLHLPLGRAAGGARRARQRSPRSCRTPRCRAGRSGCANCGWLNRLNTSSRSSESTCPNFVFLISDSVDVELRPARARVFRPVLPKVPVVSAHLLEARGVEPLVDRRVADSTGSQIWFGRLLVMPVDSMLCDCVIVERHARAQIQDAARPASRPTRASPPTAARRSSSS